MRRRSSLTLALTGALVLGLSLPAQAASFSPTTHFTLSNYHKGANPSLTVKVSQDQGEEKLAHVTLKVPKGFKLATAAQLNDGEKLGAGTIKIASEPVCNQASQGSVPVNLKFKEPTAQQKNHGVKGIYVVDLQPVTTINLLLKGSASTGWTLSGSIPQNSATCPPFQFTAKTNQKSSDTNTKIFQNAPTAGTYTFSAAYVSTKGSKKTNSQSVKII